MQISLMSLASFKRRQMPSVIESCIDAHAAIVLLLAWSLTSTISFALTHIHLHIECVFGSCALTCGIQRARWGFGALDYDRAIGDNVADTETIRIPGYAFNQTASSVFVCTDLIHDQARAYAVLQRRENVFRW